MFPIVLLIVAALSNSGDNSGSRRSNAAGDSSDGAGEYCFDSGGSGGDTIQQKLIFSEKLWGGNNFLGACDFHLEKLVHGHSKSNNKKMNAA